MSPELLAGVIQELQETDRSCRKLLLPILGSSHWVLLVLEKQAGEEDSMKYPENLQIRYYDTLKIEVQSLRQKAQQLIYDIVGAAHLRHRLPKRRNFWTQQPGTGVCGVAVLRYMQEEVRHSRGEGLGLSAVDCKTLTEDLQKLHQICQRRKAQKLKDAKPHAELTGGTHEERLQHECEYGREAIKAEEALAKKSARNKPIEYRCARCRWSIGGTGCDSKGCNPHKYLAKMEQLLKDKKFEWDAMHRLTKKAVIDVEAERMDGGG